MRTDFRLLNASSHKAKLGFVTDKTNSAYTQPKQYTSNQTNNMIQNTHKYTQNYKPLDPSINPSPYDSCVLK